MSDSAERMFALALREHRRELDLTQSELAVLLFDEHCINLDSSAITRIEKHADGPDGARVIRIGEAVAIASTLGTNLCDMLGPAAHCSGELGAADPLRTMVANQLRALAETLDGGVR